MPTTDKIRKIHTICNPDTCKRLREENALTKAQCDDWFNTAKSQQKRIKKLEGENKRLREDVKKWMQECAIQQGDAASNLMRIKELEGLLREVYHEDMFFVEHPDKHKLDKRIGEAIKENEVK